MLSAWAWRVCNAAHVKFKSGVWAVVREGAQKPYCLYLSRRPGARSIATVHQRSSRAQSGVVFDTVNLARMTCFSAEPDGRGSEITMMITKKQALGRKMPPGNHSPWERAVCTCSVWGAGGESQRSAGSYPGGSEEDGLTPEHLASRGGTHPSHSYLPAHLETTRSCTNS